MIRFKAEIDVGLNETKQAIISCYDPDHIHDELRVAGIEILEEKKEKKENEN